MIETGTDMLNEDVRRLVGRTLRIESKISALEPDAPLLGAIPELDSIAVV